MEKHCHEHCNFYDTPNFCPPPAPPTPCHPPVPSVVEGESIYEAVNNLTQRVNLCIKTYNDVMANCYAALDHLKAQAEANGAYYGPCEVWSEEGYYADESATYTITHKACVDRRNQPIRIKLHLAYNNTTNSKITQSLDSASKVLFADKIMVAQPMGNNGWYGNVILNGAPLPHADAPTLYTMGFTASGVMRVYSNAVTNDQILRDTIVDAMGVSGVLIQNGSICDDSFINTIPNYDAQTYRVCIGQNLCTREVIILTCGAENNVNKKGLTSKACANILRQYGCDIAVELCEGASAGAMDKGSLMFIPENDTIPNAYCFWYISRACFYSSDYERELAELMQNYGSCIWQTFLNKNKISDLRTDLENEINNRIEGDTALNNALNEEIQNRQTADAALNAAIAEEVKNRQDEDAKLNAAITQEIADRIAGDSALNKALETETANRIAQDAALNEAITQEIANRTAGDESLQNQLNTEIENRTNADSALQHALDKEIHDRTNADSVLHQEILTEQGERTAADTTLQQNINTEASARATADSELQAKIDQEVSDRASAITNLDNKIQGSLTTLDTRCGILERDLASLQSLYNTLQGQLTSMDTTITTVQQTITDIETSLNNVKQSIEDIRTGAMELPYLKLSGGALTGALSLGNNKITNLADPTEDSDAVTLGYLNNHGGGGSDPNAIKKDGTTVTTAEIPFAQGISTETITAPSSDVIVTASNLSINGNAGPQSTLLFMANQKGIVLTFDSITETLYIG